jgi:hypothetical protein
MRHASPTRPIALSLLLLYTSACTNWETQPVSPAQLVNQKPQQVRITHASGSKTIMASATVVGDSLIGASTGVQTAQGVQRLSTPLADVRYLEVQRVNSGKTALAVVGVGLAALLFIGAATYDGPFNSP